MPKRVQSPSSINLYKQCPRKYYYVYYKKFALLPSVHTVRGTVAHTVLEEFFDIDITGMTKENCKEKLQTHIPQLLVKNWTKAKPEFDELNLTDQQLSFFFEETVVMLFNWLNHFVDRVKLYPGDFKESFRALTPIREKKYISPKYSVRGVIDAIENAEDGVRVMDYKTSRLPVMTPEYKLQLAIYGLLYQEIHGVLPAKVGIYFLRDKPMFLNMDKELLDLAKKEIEMVHKSTESSNIADYPKKENKWCKYCEFSEICWNKKTRQSIEFGKNPGKKKDERFQRTLESTPR